MSTARPAWFSTPLGRLVRFVGSIRFAIPMMVIFALAMVWGTWVESTQDRRTAFDLVYAAWWFVTLNALICVSLVAAVITRYPWKKKHIGFATVHAGLIIVAVGGFISVFTKVEGQMVLPEGQATNRIDIPDTEQVELLRHDANNLVPAEQAPLERGTENVTLGGMAIRIVDRWGNAEPTQEVVNENPRPRHAVELALNPTATSGTWLPETAADDPRLRVAGLQIRVLPDGERFQPPAAGPTLDLADAGDGDGDGDGASAAATVDATASFMLDGVAHPIHAVPGQGADLVGETALPGWVIRSAKVLANATVGPDGLVEGDPNVSNPAIELIIAREDDSTIERHIAFARFPDLSTARVIAGDQPSGASLRFHPEGEGPAATAATSTPPDFRLVFEATDAGRRAILVDRQGALTEFDLSGPPPHDISLPFGGGGVVRVINQHRNAQFREALVEAPETDGENFPVLVVAVDEGGTSRELQLPYKQPIPFGVADGGMVFLRYGPQYQALPFTVHLDDFRKMDYPGSEMAMAYESDVRVYRGEGDPNDPASWEAFKIHMNHPLESHGWKVYQASFVGDSISIFSVATDPGLIVIYPGSIVLCTGIAIVFFSRRYSRGHPGISQGKAARGEG